MIAVFMASAKVRVLWIRSGFRIAVRWSGSSPTAVGLMPCGPHPVSRAAEFFARCFGHCSELRFAIRE